MAFASPQITAFAVEATEFPDLARKYRVTGVPKIHAVVGGFHLSGLTEERIGQVVDAFRSFEIDVIVPQHCTGIEAIAALLYRLPGKVVVSSVGSTFSFASPDAAPAA